MMNGVVNPRTQRKQGQEFYELRVPAGSMDTLVRMHNAGLVDMGWTDMPAVDPRLINWTYQSFARHMTNVQKLNVRNENGGKSTVPNRVKYISYLERHGVQLRPPSEEAWLDHIEGRMDAGAPGTTLNHYRKSMRSLLAFLDMPEWRCLTTKYAEVPPWRPPPPDEMIPHFWSHPFTACSDHTRATAQTLFLLGYYSGARPPSEFSSLNLDDVDWRTGNITVHEIKKGGKRRVIDHVPSWVLTGLDVPSLRRYVDHARPLVDVGESDALFLNGHGRRWNDVKLRIMLGRLGKQIWPTFSPYAMRRWFATEMLIENDFNVYIVAQALGDTVAVVERHYLDHAKARAARPGRLELRRRYVPGETTGESLA